jgi:hypothetical protein
MSTRKCYGGNHGTALPGFPIRIVNVLNVADVAAEVKSAGDNNESI